MSKESIFISYSRDNTEFVMNLAKNLRKSGANIWLDQLDIKAGENWDNAIQKALQESGIFLIVLSKDSVASNNVMDEVGYALGAEKKVIPVLVEQCKIPFRLERRQFVDFTGDHQKGIDNLIEALDLDSDVAEKLSDASNRSSLTAERDLEEIKQMREADKEKKHLEEKATAAKHTTKDTTEKAQTDPIKPTVTAKAGTESASAKKSKLPIYIGVAAIVILGVLGITFWDKIFPNQDAIAWENANIGNNIEIYEKYMVDHPEGEFLQAAKDSITFKNQKLLDRIDESEWQEANTVEKLIEHRTKYPNGLHVDLIEDKIKQIENEVEDTRIWNTATTTNSVDSYIAYLTNPMEGKSKVNEAIAALKNVGKTGWLYSGRTDGTIVTSDAMFKYEWRKNGGEITSNTKPVEGDIVIMTQVSRSTRSTLANAISKSGATSTWRKNKKAYVLTSTKEGTALFLQVVY